MEVCRLNTSTAIMQAAFHWLQDFGRLPRTNFHASVVFTMKVVTGSWRQKTEKNPNLQNIRFKTDWKFNFFFNLAR